MPYKFDEKQSISDQKQSNQSAQHEFIFKMYRTVQYRKKTADYVQYNNQLITLYKDLTVNIVSVLSKNSPWDNTAQFLEFLLHNQLTAYCKQTAATKIQMTEIFVLYSNIITSYIILAK